MDGSAFICVQGRTRELWLFVNIQDAIKTRKAAEEKYVKHIVDECKSKKQPAEKQPLQAFLLSKFGPAVYALETSVV